MLPLLYGSALLLGYCIIKEAVNINRHRFISEMETAWELRPETDAAPGSSAHHNRFARPAAKAKQNVKTGDKPSAPVKNRDNGS
jgi:hypothetical protein